MTSSTRSRANARTQTGTNAHVAPGPRWVTGPEEITPEIATDMLVRSQKYAEQHGMRINRSQSIGHINNLAFDMAHNNWLDTGVPIIVDVNDVVRDGQQRLAALIKSGKTLWFNVVRGVDPEGQKVMDRGRKRSVADDLYIQGIPSPTYVASTASLIIAWDLKSMMQQGRYITSIMTHKFIEPNKDHLIESLRESYRVHMKLPHSTITVFAALYYKGHDIDVEACDDFFEQLREGANLDRDNPILVLRETISRYAQLTRKPRRAIQLWQAVHAWNVWRDGKQIRFLRPPTNLTSDKFPVMK